MLITRRSWMAAGLGAVAARASVRLRIREVRLRRIRKVRDVGEIEAAWDPGRRRPVTIGGGTFVEILTEEGITGIGPAIDPSLLPAVNEHLKGKDPFDIEEHVARLRYYARGLPYRGPASVDIALWDLIGKASQQPLYKLWGGGKEKSVAYASLVRLGTPEERARQVEQLSAQGWKAVKLRLHFETLRDDVRLVELVRKAVGDRMTIMTDANQAQSGGDWQPGVRWTFERALDTARELHRMGVYWLEEPLPRYAWDQLAELNRLVDVPLAGGENNVGLHEFRTMLERGVYDILQPEGMVNMGLSDLRKIGALAEFWGKRVVPHHGGGDIGTVAHLHLVASWRHAPYFEILHDPPVGDYSHRFAIFRDPPKVDSEGMLAVPQSPGLGIEINPDLIEA